VCHGSKRVEAKKAKKESGIAMLQIGLETQMFIIALLTVFDIILFGIYLKDNRKLVGKK